MKNLIYLDVTDVAIGNRRNRFLSRDVIRIQHEHHDLVIRRHLPPTEMIRISEGGR